MTGLDFSARVARRGPAPRRRRPAPTSTFVAVRRVRRAEVLGRERVRPRVHRHRGAELAARASTAGRASSPSCCGPAGACSSARATRCCGRSTDTAPDGLLVIELPVLRARRADACGTSPARTSPRTSRVRQQRHAIEWNHGLGEIVTALLDHGMRLTTLVEHDSVPWEAMPGQMEPIGGGEYRLVDRPERLPHTYTLTARQGALSTRRWRPVWTGYAMGTLVPSPPAEGTTMAFTLPELPYDTTAFEPSCRPRRSSTTTASTTRRTSTPSTACSRARRGGRRRWRTSS